MSGAQGWRGKLDRTSQRLILEALADEYPEAVSVKRLYGTIEAYKLTPNISYLEEHGLVKASYSGDKESGHSATVASITHKGLDFIQDDGGLGAILDVVTVKLHEETLKAIIESKVLASDLSESEKNRFVGQLRELPGEATKHLVLRLLDAGMDNWPKALSLLKAVLGS
ncbi:TPA: hypothetical protein QEK98_002890 [Stenotrophomonas maltophilia]|nr:hypothetical protein [Stenotrophomonas maltophilia]